MSQTQPKLERGEFAYSSHSLRLAGSIHDVFIGKWETPDGEECRKLKRFNLGEEVPGGELMCVLRLREPMGRQDYKEFRHPGIRPVVKGVGSSIKFILMDAGVVCTFPDAI
jgi:hypothetical protein